MGEGEGEPGGQAPGAFGGDVGEQPAPGEPQGDDPEGAPEDGGEGLEATDNSGAGEGAPDANIDVQPIEPDEGTPDTSAPLVGNGVSLGGTCVPLCASSATDADAMGVTDGWGYENDASCLVEGSIPAGQGPLCDLAGSVPLPPPIPRGSNVIRPEGVESTGFFVSGGRLFDALGNDFVMRGVNNPLAWFLNRTTGALAWTEQIASTGANTVRLVWETDVPSANIPLLREAIQRTVELGMIPMVELHDVTGGRDIDEPARMARYYTETDAVRQILLDYEDYLLVNIANEWDGGSDIYVEAYTRAIQTLRGAGINHTLVIDANGYGQNANTVITQGPTLLGIDPQHNLLFSTHMYQSFRNAETIRDTLQRAADAQIPFIVGEFGFQHGEDQQGNPIPIPFQVLLDEAERHGFGYLAWSWTGNGGGVEYLDLTARSGSAEQLSVWGDDIVNGPNGIRATSEPASIFLSL